MPPIRRIAVLREPTAAQLGELTCHTTRIILPVRAPPIAKNSDGRFDHR